jgi:AcrR family transcriptional regulator
MTKKRPLRADAERNRQRVLEVAQTVFATEGLAVPIDEVARRAGLGVGTLYRHFPTKEALFLAIVLDRMERLAADAAAGAEAPDPGEAFFRFLERMVEEGSAKRDLVDALSGTSLDFGRAAKEVKKRLHDALALLLARAQKVGAVREDVGVLEVLALVTGTFASMDRLGSGGARGRERLFAVVCDGLRGRGGRGGGGAGGPRRPSS